MGAKESRQPLSRIQQSPEKIKRLTHLLNLKSEQQQTMAVRGWDGHDQDVHNNKLLKGVFKKLDPTIMKPVGAIKGEIQLSFKYDVDTEILLVKVIKCRELCTKDVRARLVDTFVRLILIPDPQIHGEKTTHIVQQTTCPHFDEIFSYQIPEVALGDGKLVVQVLDHSLGGYDDVIGEVIVNLNSFSFHANPVFTGWYSLNAETDLTITGDLDISIAFQIPKTLLVTVHGASNLTPKDNGRSADPFVKVAVPGCDVVYQTQVKKNTLNPVWSETFEFPVHEEELEDRYVVFHVIDKDTFSSNDSLGQCIVELKEMDPDRGLHGNYTLADLKNSERLRAVVHQKRTAQEFKESLLAHSISRAPSYIFQSHSGKKIVTVTCRKAGAQGRIRVIDGIPIH